MSASDPDHAIPGMENMALADSLSTLRQLIDANRCTSVAELISATVNALIQHQDFDGCMVIIDDDIGPQQRSLPGQRTAARMPWFLDPLLSAEVVPAMMHEGLVFLEPRLSNRAPDWHGSLLGVPVIGERGALGGLIVWNQESDVLMPWHQNLLEMLGEVFMLVLGSLAAIDAGGHRKVRGPGVPMLTPGAGSADQTAEGGFASVGRAVDLIDRHAFEQRLEDIATLPVTGARYLLFVDIDRFRLIREYGGDTTAERTVRILADILRREVADDTLIGHLAIDQFGMVIEHRSRDQTIQLAESLVRIVDSLHLSFSGQRYDISISVGIAELKSRPDSGSAALRQARHACGMVQKRGGGAVRTHDANPTQRNRSRDDGRLLNRLTRALKDDDLELYAQLIAPRGSAVPAGGSLKTMHEILLRMRDDGGNLIGAGPFLAVAERYGLSVKLDRWLINRAFSQIAASRFADDSDHRFTLNLSGHSIDDHGLLAFIVEKFEQSGLAPQRICFEITETAAISDIGAAIGFVEALKKLGCEFALDDFGSGYSSFLYLRDLPIDYLKIDGELVREIVDDSVSLAFVRTIQGVAQLMGKRTIAEYVENEAIRDAIAEIGCDYLQGYCVGNPLPLTELLEEFPGELPAEAPGDLH